MQVRHVLLLLAALACGEGRAADPQAKPGAYDPALAAQAGGDENGMRQYVLVILRTGPTRVPDGEARKAMFAGHFANMERLSKAGKLVLAGPFGDKDVDWRGLFVFAVADVEEAKALVATDPVIIQGEMVAEYHSWYGSAATVLLPGLHGRIVRSP